MKLLSPLGLLLVTALVRHLPVLLGTYLVTLGLAAASGLPLGFFVRRVWLFIPVFTGIVVLPATFSFVTPGEVVVPLWHWHGHPVGLTRQGLVGAGLIVARVATSISLVVPRIFILVVGMAYRYLFLLLGSVTDMFEARKARSVGAEVDAKAGRRFVAAAAGTLFGRSWALSEEVHQAMLARGYRATPGPWSGSRRRRSTRPGRWPASPWPSPSWGGPTAWPLSPSRCWSARTCTTPTWSASPPWTTSPSPSTGASGSRCWAPTAAASRPC